jgi:hypothetical protein
MKYIVYLTTNKVNKKIYIGVHATETPEKFDGYYGCGVSRKHPVTHPKTPFQYAIKKYGYDAFERSTIQIFDSYEEAFKLEEEIVNDAFIKRIDTYNVILGGGRMPNNSKVVYQYDLKGNFIKSWKSAIIAGKELKVCPTLISQAVSHHTTSLKSLWSFEKYDILPIENFTIYNPEKKLYIYNLEGNFIKEYDSMNSFAKEYNTSISHINRAIKQKYVLGGVYITDEKVKNFTPAVRIKLTGAIHQYSLEGTYIQSFKDIKEVELKFGENMRGINPSIRQGKSYKNFLWLRGEKQDFVKPIKKTKGIARKVGQYTLDGKLIKIYNSVREARKNFSAVDKMLRGERNHINGFIFKYED